MYVIVWRFEARAGREEEFERAYGPGGDWARLFARGEGYLGTDLLRDTAAARRYLAVDRWRGEADYEAFRRQQMAEYAALDRRCEELTEREERVGAFEAVP